MFSYLGEINEIHLGFSKEKSKGNGMGPGDAIRIFKQLKDNKALKKGVLEGIEDMKIFIEKVGIDKISDMVANIIRKPLLDYTMEQCILHNIPLTDNVLSGFFWNATKKEWDTLYTQRMIIEDTPVLLVPKKYVVYSPFFAPTKYRQYFVLNYLQDIHLIKNSSLVKMRKDKSKYVTKKSIIAKEPIMDKSYLTSFTLNHLEIFNDFKKEALKNEQSLRGDLLEKLNIDFVCKSLADKLISIPPGKENAGAFHSVMIGIFELLFYPTLLTPSKEDKFHDGRKRVDITFFVSSEYNYFISLAERSQLPCSKLMIECKNYNADAKNPELDQLSGRFSYSKGKIGILSCRNFIDEDLFIHRCIDTFKDGRGLIIPVTDDNILNALEKGEKCRESFEKILDMKFKKIVDNS
ncbi:MAG: hypothetical protein RR266_02245 [Bacilli bacterium]